MSVPPKPAPDRTRPEKKPYVPPRLVRFGRFADIVQGRGGVKSEPGGPQTGPKSRA